MFSYNGVISLTKVMIQVIHDHCKEAPCAYEAAIAPKASQTRRTMPLLSKGERERIMRVLMESLGMRSNAEFRLFHAYEQCAAIGVVDRVDPYNRTFMIDGESFQIDDIIGASLISTDYDHRS